MALRLARMVYVFTPTSLSPHRYQGTFWDTVALAFVVRAVSFGTVQSPSAVENELETTFPADTFEWGTPAPPAP